jgi:hypothetical protein
MWSDAFDKARTVWSRCCKVLCQSIVVVGISLRHDMYDMTHDILHQSLHRQTPRSIKMERFTELTFTPNVGARMYPLSFVQKNPALAKAFADADKCKLEPFIINHKSIQGYLVQTAEVEWYDVAIVEKLRNRTVENLSLEAALGLYDRCNPNVFLKTPDLYKIPVMSENASLAKAYTSVVFVQRIM